MRTRLRHLRDRLRSNLWLVPAAVVIALASLAIGTLAADARFDPRLAEAPLLFTGGPQGASAVLSAIAGSMIGVVGVTFSITIVALSLASTQFGPRLLRTFMHDRANQVVLGVLMGTFVFSLLALHAVDSPDEPDAVPELTVNVAAGLALVSLAALIFFLHHIAHHIQADTVIADVAGDLHRTIDDLYPERLGRDASRGEEARPRDIGSARHPLRAPRTGYVQALDEETLLSALVQYDLFLRLLVRPGDFVVEGQPLANVSAMPDAARSQLQRAFFLGRQRTPEQDVEFSIAQLVEVGVRALSPGINDPFTAIRCIDRLSAALCHLAQRRIPSPYRAGRDGILRIHARTTTWEGAVDFAFSQLRQSATSHVAVVIALLEGIERVEACLPAGDARLAALQKHRRQIAEVAERAGHASDDLEDIRQRLRGAASTPAEDALREARRA